MRLHILEHNLAIRAKVCQYGFRNYQVLDTQRAASWTPYLKSPSTF